MVNMSSQDRCCKTPIRQITPITPNESMDSFFASSSMLRCSGVRFSSTCSRSGSARMQRDNNRERESPYVLHHGKNDTELGIDAGGDDDARSPTVADQGAHVDDARPVGQRDRLAGTVAVGKRPWIAVGSGGGGGAPFERAGVDGLSTRVGFARETGLVDFEVDGGDETDVSRDAVAGGEGDDVAWDELVREDVDGFLVPGDVTVVRDELVERFEAFFGPSFLNEADCWEDVRWEWREMRGRTDR